MTDKQKEILIGLYKRNCLNQWTKSHSLPDSLYAGGEPLDECCDVHRAMFSFCCWLKSIWTWGMILWKSARKKQKLGSSRILKQPPTSLSELESPPRFRMVSNMLPGYPCAHTRCLQRDYESSTALVKHWEDGAQPPRRALLFSCMTEKM